MMFGDMVSGPVRTAIIYTAEMNPLWVKKHLGIEEFCWFG